MPPRRRTSTGDEQPVNLGTKLPRDPNPTSNEENRLRQEARSAAVRRLRERYPDEFEELIREEYARRGLARRLSQEEMDRQEEAQRARRRGRS